MSYQPTNFNRLISTLKGILNPIFDDVWRIRSLRILSLLCGFFCTSILASYFIHRNEQRIFVATTLLIIIELMVRLRYLYKNIKYDLLRNSLDNFRIGSTFVLVLEAIKLGS